MKKLLLIIGLIMATPALASKLDDVTVLEVTQKTDAVELKLHTKAGPKDSFFFVDVLKSDEKSSDKLALVTEKQKAGDDFKLSLDIKSFSVKPSGSRYKSPHVKFSGAAAKK